MPSSVKPQDIPWCNSGECGVTSIEWSLVPSPCPQVPQETDKQQTQEYSFFMCVCSYKQKWHKTVNSHKNEKCVLTLLSFQMHMNFLTWNTEIFWETFTCFVRKKTVIYMVNNSQGSNFIGVLSDLYIMFLEYSLWS